MNEFPMYIGMRSRTVDPRGCDKCIEPFPGADNLARCRVYGVPLPFDHNAPIECSQFEEKKDEGLHERLGFCPGLPGRQP